MPSKNYHTVTIRFMKCSSNVKHHKDLAEKNQEHGRLLFGEIGTKLHSKACISRFHFTQYEYTDRQYVERGVLGRFLNQLS